jgi:hypothetical protein
MTARLWVAVLAAHLAWSTHLVVGYGFAGRVCAGDPQWWALNPWLTAAALAATVAAGGAALLERRAITTGGLAVERRFVADLALVLSGVFGFAIVLAGAASALVPANCG